MSHTNIRPRPARTTIPFDVFTSQVDALHKDPRTLVAGSFAATAAGGYIALIERQAILGLVALSIGLISLLRAFDIVLYWRNRGSLITRSDFRSREQRYVTLAAIHVGSLCSLPAFVFALSDNAAERLLAFAIAIGYLAGISGRNFASRRLVIAQVVASVSPLVVSLLIAGVSYYPVIVLGLLPFFIGTVSISGRLRDLLTEAVLSERTARQLAGRFDVALNNMPHGLLMFDKSGALVVANRRSADLLGVAPRLGLTPEALLRHAKCSHGAGVAALRQLASELVAAIDGGASCSISSEAINDLVLKIVLQPIPTSGLVVLLEDITEQRKAETLIRTLATCDTLTSLPNRTSFTAEFERLLAQSDEERSCALLFVDLDDFKRVNDTLGHSMGDRLLSAVAQRLQQIVEPGDVVARLGGDEFVMLLPSVSTRAEVGDVATRVIKAIKEPFDIADHKLLVGVTIGVAMAPADGDDASELLKKADMALYEAKRKGKGDFAFFEPDMQTTATARLALETDLRFAAQKGEFTLNFQPLFSLETGRVSSCEALVRWRHAERGFVSPAEFIPIAEETGLITEIGEFVLRQACIEALNWPSDVRVAVNISPIQFERTDLVAIVEQTLAATGLPPERLELEITESALLRGDSHTNVCLNALRAKGIRIALDDFGTGYSSLSYLREFPIDKLKIDRSFVRDIETNAKSLALLKSVAQMCSDLGLTVVIEGIETPGQLRAVNTGGTIHEAQGYLLSRPLPPMQARTLLKTVDMTQQRDHAGRKRALSA